MRTARAQYAALPFFVLALLAATDLACSRAAPAAPDSPSPALSASAASQISNNATAAPTSGQFGLRSGTFSLTTPDGDTLSGSYTGTTFVSASGKRSTSLVVQVTGGSGAFQGALGTLSGDGDGAFIEAGAFDLTLRGAIQTDAQPAGFRFRASLAGLASLACVAPNIVITLEGDGAIAKGAAIHGVFTHTLVGPGCS